MGGILSKSNSGQPKIIVLLGPSGCGKSQFIQYLVPTDQKDSVPVNASVKPQSQGVLQFKMANRDGHCTDVILVDTPGFDDVGPDGVLKQVVKWIKQNHPNKKVTGILCLHRITDNRLTSSNRPPTNILKDLCGKKANAAKQVALVTTHWDYPKFKMGEKAEREKKLEEQVWASLSKMGAKLERFNNTPESARDIVERLLD